MRKNKVIMLTMLLLTLGAQQLLASTITYAVGTCKPALPSYTTISEAVAASPAPNVVEVCPGTYNEQVNITQPMTLEGITQGESGQVIIATPSGGLSINAEGDGSFPASIAAQILVSHVSGVTISNLTLDAANNGVSNGNPAGIFFQDSSGTINRVTTRDQSGTGGGVGIWVEGGADGPTVTVENSGVYNYDNNGIYAEAMQGSFGGVPTLTVVIESNDVDGSGECCHGQGINVYGEIAATVKNNVVAKNLSYGIILGGQSLPSGSVTSNTLVDNGGEGIAAIGALTVSSNKIWGSATAVDVFGSVTVQSNSIFNSQTAINFECEATPTVSSNTINGAVTGLASVPVSVGSSNTYVNVGTIRTSGC
jgi:hypothetical protein